MVWAIAIVLGLLWILGMATARVGGGFVHLLLAAVIVLVGYGIYRRHRERHAP